ncbi:MAG: substrate-binding domain-containing protein, partial [Pyrinomonadaceae bacterium]
MKVSQNYFRSLHGLTILSLLLLLIFSVSCSKSSKNQDANQKKPVKIGFSIDSLKDARWQRDRDLFIQQANVYGGDVIVEIANGDDSLQAKQIDEMLAQGIEVLVIVPHNSEVAAKSVEAAKARGIPVISYDRLVRNCDLDLYVSYDAVKVGELQAQYLLNQTAKGNYVLIGGAPTDNNAALLHTGNMTVLQPAIDRGDIKIVYDQPTNDWLASEAQSHAKAALEQAKDDVQAILVSNDNMAGGVAIALAQRKLTDKVLVTGEDADLSAIKRIIEGKQTMTVYKPLQPLAKEAAKAAITLARKEKVRTKATANNG